MHMIDRALRSIASSALLSSVALAHLATAAPARAQAQAPAQQTPLLAPETVMLTIDLGPGEPPLAVTLAELMQVFRVPGMSIAVVKDNRIAFSASFGVTEAGGTAPVTPATLFQAASISKPVTAMGALWLVERGKLSLDADVNTQLKGWKLPESPLAAARKVTLRRLMTHNAGLNVHGFAGYAQGMPVPGIEQILDGKPPANSPAVRVTVEPGTQCIYSGGGVTIEGLMIREAAGQPFEEFMAARVLRPAGMTSSSFAQALPPELAARAASGTGPDGAVTPGKWHVYPELAPDGLWTTAEDLARLGIEVSLSREGKANHVLSQAMTREMLTPHCPDDPGKPGGIGLGFGVGYGGHPGQFRHNGANEGFQSLMFNAWQNTPQRDNDGMAASIITDIADTTDVVTVTTGPAFAAGHLVRMTGFSNVANNGVFKVTTGSATVPAMLGANFAAEAAPPAAARMKVVGFEGAAGDITALADGLGSTALDFTGLGLRVG